MIPCPAQSNVVTAPVATHCMVMAPTFWSTRRDLSEAPAALRAWLAAALGDEPASWTTAIDGFSPGIAARLVTADGRRAFVKAVDGSSNPDTPDLFRTEANALCILGADPATRRLIAPMLDSYDDDGWVALLLTDVDGTTPAQPFRAADVEVIGAGLTELAAALGQLRTDAELPSMGVSSLPDSWAALAEEPALLDPWTRQQVPLLVDLAEHSRQALQGTSLLHFDVRSDNILLTGAGDDRRAVFVDWAWLRYSAGWLDAFLFGSTWRQQGATWPHRLMSRTHPCSPESPHVTSLPRSRWSPAQCCAGADSRRRPGFPASATGRHTWPRVDSAGCRNVWPPVSPDS